MGDWPTARLPTIKCVERGRKKRPEIKSKSFQNESSEQTKFRGKWLWCADICQDGHKLALIATASFCPAPNHLYWGKRCFVLNLSSSPWMNANVSNWGFKKTKHVYDTMLEYCICIYMYLFVFVFAFPFEFVFVLCTSRAFAVLGQCSFSCLTAYPCLEVELIFNMGPHVTHMYTQHLVPAQHLQGNCSSSS